MGSGFHHIVKRWGASLLRLATPMGILALLASCHSYWGPTDSPHFDDKGRGYLVIERATGGNLAKTRIKLESLHERDVLIVVNGLCFSACTLVLNPKYDNVCWTDQAEFLFHGAFLPAGKGRQEIENDPMTTDFMWRHYPEEVKDILPPPVEWSHDVFYRLYPGEINDTRHCDNSALYKEKYGSIPAFSIY